MKNPKIMNRIKEHYDIIASKGYEIVGIFLQGSQNYELDYEGSDVDTKAIVLPKFEDFVLSKKPISTTLELENKEHIDIKDIRLMFECFKKQNINFVEILFTKYFILNSKYAHLFRPMFENREQIAHYNNYAAVNCIAGMGLEKYKAMEHPYEGLLDKINKHGYDCKQLHHIIRMNEFIKRYISGEKYADCLISNNKDYLLQVKQNLHTLEEARIIAKSTVEELVQIKNNYMNDTQLLVDNHVDDIMKKVLIYIIKYNFQTEIGNIKRNKPKFIMMVGLPASGKSKIAEELSTLYKAKIHSSDEIRTELINDVNCQDMNAKVFELLHRRIKDDLRNGQSVIYDATNIHYKRRKAFIYELQRTDCEKRCVFVATPYEKCKIQNADRERSVPIEVINRMYKNIYIPQKYEGWDDISIVWNYDMSEYESNKDLFDGENGLCYITQDNPHHTLTIGHHCIKCYEHLTEQGYDLKIAGLYHDIGKAFCKDFTDSNGAPTNIAHYYQHHLVSAYMSLFYLKSCHNLSDDRILEIANLIQWHMKPYMNWNNESEIKKFKDMVGEEVYTNILILNEADMQAH